MRSTEKDTGVLMNSTPEKGHWIRILGGGWRSLSQVQKVSLMYLLLISVVALLADQLAPFSFDAQNLEDRLLPPHLPYWFGTDSLGRDLFSRILYGSRVSLAVGVVTALLSGIVGTAVGATAGYFGGWVDRVLDSVIHFFSIFPSLLIAILMSLIFGRGFTGILLSIALTSWVQTARLIRGLTFQTREMLYVQSAQALGASSLQVILKHILPQLRGPLLISLTFQVPSNLMAESFLSFIGLGLQPPYSSWGTLAAEGFRAMRSYPHLMIFPGLALSSTLLAFHFLGEQKINRSHYR